MDCVVYHNPKCSKSRKTMELLKENGVEPEVVHYLDGGVGKEELQSVLSVLGISAEDLARKKEDLYKDLGLAGKGEEAHLEALVNHPKLIERPIVVCGTKAVIGRPPEKVLELFNS